MEYSKQNNLDACIERHRADFDLHEPRPELWAALEKQLHGTSSEEAEPVMNIVAGGEEQMPLGRQLSFEVPAEQPIVRRRWAWAEQYSIAAALAVLIVAAGLGEAWKSGQVARERTGTTASTGATMPIDDVADAALYLAPSSGLEVSHTTNARLDTAVHGMETYYVSQLADRKTELSQLAPDATADWARELVELDSSYQQLKRELPRHPQPEAVLTAMNRNLQIRLDILDQQIEFHGPAPTAGGADTRGEFAIADSRRSSISKLRHGR